MATANPLPSPQSPWSDGPLDDLTHLPPEVRAAIESAEERIATGTARLVRQEDVPAALEEMRRRKAG